MILNEIIEYELKSLDSLNKIKELYEFRLCLIKTGYSKKEPYEKNEVDILIMKTHLLIERLDKNISEKKESFIETYGRMIEEFEFQDKNIE